MRGDVASGIWDAAFSAALVFLKRHVELPVQTILDRPMVAYRFGKTASRKVLTENVVPDFIAVPLITLGVTNGNPDRLTESEFARRCTFPCVPESVKISEQYNPS